MRYQSNASWFWQTYVGCDTNATSRILGRKSNPSKARRVGILDLTRYQLLLVLALTYIWPPTLTKLAILVLYWRINPSRIFRGCILGTAVMLLAYTITFTVLFGGPCNPLATGSGVCLNNIAIAQAVLNIVTDAIIIVLPIPTIHQLNMPMKQKIQVGVILALGSAYVLPCLFSVTNTLR
jgi:hypothetical protein